MSKNEHTRLVAVVKVIVVFKMLTQSCKEKKVILVLENNAYMDF